MTLPDLDLGERAPGNVATAQLQTGAQHLLRQSRPLAQSADVASDALFDFHVHLFHPFALIFAQVLDFIIAVCYNQIALV